MNESLTILGDVKEPSPRQLQVLVLLARGRTQVEVAAELKISRNTVARHLQELYRKFGVRNVGGAIGVAVSKNLIQF